MKQLIIILIFTTLILSCTNPKQIDSTITNSEPSGYIDSLSHNECRKLPKPVKQ